MHLLYKKMIDFLCLCSVTRYLESSFFALRYDFIDSWADLWPFFGAF